MSQQDVELLLNLWRDWNATSDVAAIARDYWHPDIEWHVPEGWAPAVGGTVRRGRQAVIQQSLEFAEHMGHLHIEVVEVIDAGHEVFANLLYRGRGEKSAAGVGIPAFHVTRVEDNRVRRVRVFATRDDAARAAGLIAN
jgi:ketosteroid isomerase-like protein